MRKLLQIMMLGFVWLLGTQTIAAQYYPDKLYVPCDMNGWDFNEYWTLGHEGDGIYRGSFQVGEGSWVAFKITGDASWDDNYGAPYPGNEFNLFSNKPYECDPMIYDGNNFIVKNWKGGELVITVNWNNKSIIVEGPQQPEYILNPEVLYLVGNYNGGVTPDNEEFFNNGGITLVDQDGDGIYEGEINYSDDNVLQFKFLSDKVGGEYDSNIFGTNEYLPVTLSPNVSYEWQVDSPGNDFIIENLKGKARISVDYANERLSVISEEVAPASLFVDMWGYGITKMNQSSDNSNLYTYAFDEVNDCGFIFFYNNNRITASRQQSFTELYKENPVYQGYMGNEEEYFRVVNWQPGPLTLTYNVNTNEVTLTSENQPEFAYPEKLYLSGNFNGWEAPWNDNFEESGGIILEQQSEGVYSGTLNYDASEDGYYLEFCFYNSDVYYDGARFGASYWDNIQLKPNIPYTWNANQDGGYNFYIGNWLREGNITIDYNAKTVTVTAQEVKPDEVYVEGSINDILSQSPENSNIYTGQFYYYDNYFHLGFIINGRSYYTGNDGYYQIYSDYAVTDYAQEGGYWISCNNWEGGLLNVSINIETLEFTLEGPDQPSVTENYPQNLYIYGYFGDNYPTQILLQPNTGEPGVYSIELDVPAYAGPYFYLYELIEEGGYTYANYYWNNVGKYNLYNNYDVQAEIGKYSSNMEIQCMNWQGGKLGITINFNDNTMIIEGPDQPASNEDNVLYVIGDVDPVDHPSWNKYYSSQILYPVGDGVYEGDFTVYNYGYNAYFGFLTELGDLDQNSIGAYSGEEEVNLSADNNVFEGRLMPSNNRWYLPDWGGFTIHAVVDLNNGTVKFEADVIEELYLVGNFNNWQTPGNPDFGGVVLNYNPESRRFEGTLETAGDAVAFKVFSKASNDWRYSWGTEDNVKPLNPYWSTYYEINEDANNIYVSNWTGSATVAVEWPNKAVYVTSNNEVSYPTAPNAIYFSGNVNNWSTNDGNYALLPIESGYSYVRYRGEFELPSGLLNFKLVQDEVIEYKSNQDQFLLFGGEILENDLTTIGNSWDCANWQGGKLIVTVDYYYDDMSFNGRVSVEGPDQPVKENAIYIVGSLNAWNIYDSTYKLPLTNEYSMEYQALLNIPGNGDDVYFRLFPELGTWYSIGTTSYYNEEVTFTYNMFSDNYMNGSEGNWVLPNWNGGLINFIVNTNDMKITMFKTSAGGGGSGSVDTIEGGYGEISIAKGIVTAPGASKIVVVNAAGQTVAGGNGETLDINHLPKGVYVITTPEHKPLKIVK